METIEDKLRKYAELKAVEKSAKDGLDLLKPEIQAHIESLGVDKLPTTLGIFSIEKRGTWKYTEAVEALQEEEKATGKAIQKFTTFIKFAEPKADKIEE